MVRQVWIPTCPKKLEFFVLFCFKICSRYMGGLVASFSPSSDNRKNQGHSQEPEIRR